MSPTEHELLAGIGSAGRPRGSTIATVVTKLGWNIEYVRAALGHADYKELQTYVRLATERDLGPRKDWLDFIVASPVVEWM